MGFVFLVLGCISVIGYMRFINPQITEVPINVDRNNQSEDELNIIAISDIHLGNVIRKDRLAKWVKLINRQNADIIMIAGDMFDHNMNTVESQQMDIELSRLNAKYGVYAIPGNHDYYAGIDRAMLYMKKSGIRVLRDQTVTIDHRLVIIGRDDLSNRKRKSLSLLLTGVNAKLPRIVLDHQPLSFAESRENNVDLHISGHTHNGQIFPFNRIVSKIYELGYGYKKAGNTNYYVSSGLGLWGAPIRLGTQSEIVKFILKTKPSVQ
jgi:predicted MPP superfamily phosphohydrolase